jgi:iron-sulfur cluster assembly accessory protein
MSITVTDRAATRIAEITAAEAVSPVLRVSVEGGGCSGFQYKFDLVGSHAADDLVIERNGAVVVIDPVSVQYMEGSEIDFVDDLIGASFQIKNPVATASCGCGTSFSI